MDGTRVEVQYKNLVVFKNLYIFSYSNIYQTSKNLRSYAREFEVWYLIQTSTKIKKFSIPLRTVDLEAIISKLKKKTTKVNVPV